MSIASDASDIAMGAVLQQKIDNNWYPLSFFSKTFNKAQKKYSVYNRELLAIYEAEKHFRNLVEGKTFTIITDLSLTHFLRSPRRLHRCEQDGLLT